MKATQYDIVLETVSKVHGDGPQAVTALRDVSLAVELGEFVAVVGPSGSGKSTLLNLAAGLEVPTRGRVAVGGEDLARLSDDARSDLRLRQIGFVFQSFNLLPTFTAEENVGWPLEFLGVGRREARRRASHVLERVGVPTAARVRRPAELSGGEQQRVAIARALVAEPRLVLADEPTGNLDSHTGRTVLDLLRALNLEHRVTVIMVTHGALATGVADRIVVLRDGRLLSEGRATDRPGDDRLTACGPEEDVMGTTFGYEMSRPNTDYHPSEESWIAWPDVESAAEWQALQLAAWGMFLGAALNGSGGSGRETASQGQ
jgi:putative ABC transport system ATP-binding protein